MAKDIFIKKLTKLPPKHVVAYSMGGRIALEALILHNAPFLSLTCLSTTLAIDDIKKRQLKEKTWIYNLKNMDLKQFINYWYSQALFTGFKPPPERYIQNKTDLINILQQYSTLHCPPLVNKIQSCKSPIQFVYKENDPKARYLSGYKNLYFVKSKSHCIHLENPKSCIKIIKQYYNNN